MATMRRWVTSRSYRIAIERLVECRIAAGLTQRDVADRLRKPASYVAKIELGERRLDLVEFIALSRALEVEPAVLLGRIADELGDQLDI